LGQALIVVDRGVGFGPAELASWWAADGEATDLGKPSVQEGANSAFGPEIFEWVAVPLAVNLASNVLYDLVKRLITRARAGASAPADVVSSSPAELELELVHSTTGEGDPVVVVRSRASSGR
jgi:hypothetical protein